MYSQQSVHDVVSGGPARPVEASGAPCDSGAAGSRGYQAAQSRDSPRSSFHLWQTAY